MKKDELISWLKESKADQFHEAFNCLMKKIHCDDYHGIEPYGKKGDKKVDGILKNKTAFQVYAPKNYKDKNAISKIKTDFKVFLSHKEKGTWKKVDKFIFVIRTNTDQGVTADVINTVADMEDEYQHLIKVWSLKDVLEVADDVVDKELPKEINSEICSDISSLKDYYQVLYNHFSEYTSSAVFLRPVEEDSNNARIQLLNQMTTTISHLNAIKNDNYSLLLDNNILKEVENIIKTRVPFKGTIIDIPVVYENITYEKMHKKRINQCDKLLKKLKKLK